MNVNRNYPDARSAAAMAGRAVAQPEWARMPMGSVLLALALASVLLGLAGGALALPSGASTGCIIGGNASAQFGTAPFLDADSHSFSDGCGGSGVEANGRVDVPTLTDNGATVYSFHQSAATDSSARATFGSLGVYSHSEARSSPQNYLFSVGGVGAAVDNHYSATSNSSALAFWSDRITVDGPPGPNGFIVLRFTLDLDGSATATPGATAGILARLFIDDRERFIGDQILGLNEAGSISGTIGFRPGTSFEVYGDLSAHSDAVGGAKLVCNLFFCVPAGYIADSSATSDAFHTAGFFIDVVTAGASYETESGESYLTAAALPVPEPAAGLLLCGALGVSAIGRRRGRG